jgi:multiple sugar transport system ATP-binding protein
VTHDQVEAMTMGHRIAIMKDGKLQQVGTPLEVYEQPANLFVAAFIGTPPMNFVKAALADGGTTLKAGSFSLPVAQSYRALTAGKDGRALVVGIRAENLSDGSRPVRGESARVPATVEIVEPLGHEVLVYARLGGDDLVVAKVDPHRAPAFDEKIELVVELETLHLFDAATERRLTA